MLRCETAHRGSCEVAELSSIGHPLIRLIDIEQRCIILAELDCRFTALSYVWGSSTIGLLTKSTLADFSRPGGLTDNKLPRTILETMVLLAELAERYVWVDSACIIQDDFTDKRKYLPMMGDIYHHAALVVIAAVETADEGLPGTCGHLRSVKNILETIQGISFTASQPQLRDRLKASIWGTRGWTYQEAQLARRALVVTPSQVYWSCRGDSWCEEQFTEFENIRVPPQTNSLFSTLAMNSGITACNLRDYSDRVGEFSSRCFYNPRDTFWAFLGILRMLSPKFKTGYIWGIPKARIGAGLLWESITFRFHRGQWSKSEEIPIPDMQGNWVTTRIPSCSVHSMVDWHEPVQYSNDRSVTSNDIEKDWGSVKEAGEKNSGGSELGEDNLGNDYLEEDFSEDDNSEGNDTFPASALARSSKDSKLCEFALLSFTAQSTTLVLRKTTRRPDSELVSLCCSMVYATLVIPPRSGCELSPQIIGSIRVPIYLFLEYRAGGDQGTESLRSAIDGKFILLSSCTKFRQGSFQSLEKYQKLKESEDSSAPEEPGSMEQPNEPVYNIMLINWKKDKKTAYRVSWTQVLKSDWERCCLQTKKIILG
ncbi:heterokaryon incompatibility protein-domain-containing protein [Xylariaceae sp. FL0255]|nr:heterokaryon incompatibility protein-domain-containing protein [Xylariaceae sp. FL0255]